MRFVTVLTLGIAVVSTSASLVVRQTVPACYDTCAAEADISGCNAADIKCLCDNPTYVSETITCLQEICKGADLGNSIAIGQTVCLEAGATLSVSIGLSVPTSTSSSPLPTISNLKSAAAVHDPSNFVGLAAVGLVALAIY